MNDSRRQWLAVLALVALTAAVYAPVLGFGFVNHDDDRYLVQNPMVQQGLNPQTVGWAFSTLYFSNWHPVTWISYLVDIELFGLHPGALHAINLMLHLVNTLLLALVLHRMTRRFWPAIAVAALFALHPLHVESVAWISERKDVLSTLFWLLAMLAYTEFARSQRRSAYVVCLLCFALGLMAKPMVITLPFVLLLCDYWPLQRASRWGRLVAEKIPFFVLAAGSAVITLIAQQSGKAIGSLESLPMWARLNNAVLAYAGYLLKTIWPLRLSAFYPHPGTAVVVWKVALALAVLLAITAWAWRARRTRPYLLVGWLWFLGTLVPVIGIIQVGSQAMADRYTYVPLIGIFLAVVWLAADYAAGRRGTPEHRVISGVRVGAAGTALAVLAVLSAGQVWVWRDSIALFSHALAVTPKNSMVHTNLAVAYAEAGRFEEAIPHFEEVLALDPHSARTYYNLALVYERLGRADTAEPLYRQALDRDADYADARNNLGMILMGRGDREGARAQFQAVLHAAPRHLMARINLGDLEAGAGNAQQAAAWYEQALEIFPPFALAYYKLAYLHHRAGRPAEAVGLLEESLRLNPAFDDAQALLRQIKAER
jgi:protein O-mannosyl-transferase